MNPSAEKNSQWSGASREAIPLALITVLTTILSTWTGNGVISAILWAVKVAGSLWLLFFFMKRWAAATGATSAFGYGFKICLCSALICALSSYLIVEFLFPETVKATFDIVYQSLPAAGMTDELRDALALMEDNYAQINGIAQLLWCTVCGLVFSAIYSRSAAAGNIFKSEGDNDDEEFKD